MAKKSKKRAGRNDRDQAGCMWSLLNIFDFRQVRPSQKLILDKKRGSKRLDGTVYANIKLESLSDSCHICNESKDTVQNETTTIDTSKMSVKELMQEEMYSEQDREKQGSIASEDPKRTSNNSSSTKKNRRWSRSKMSLDLEADGFVTGDFVGKPSHRKHKSCSSVDLNEMVEELCSRIQQKDSQNSNRLEDGKFSVKPIEDSSVVEKQLGEAARVLVNHFTEGKTGTKERKIQSSKELADALQLLNSNKEKFLKLLQDPNSQLVKHIQSLQDIQVEEGKFNVLTGSDLLEQDIGSGKQPYFFWRKFNSQERNSSRKSDIPIDLSRIVVLKPGPPSSKNSDAGSTCSSLPESPKSTKDKDGIHKSSSPFTFAEFKRKLKHAMRKEQREVSHPFSDEQLNTSNRDTKVGGETFTMASPSRDHFLNDRIPKSSVRKLKDGKIQLENEHGLTTEERVSSIYIEAKRHLAEIVGNSDADLDTLGRKVPRSLGRILSYSGYNSPTICSPRTDPDIRRSSNAESRNSVEKASSDVEEVSVKPICEEDIPGIESLNSDGLPLKLDVDKTIDQSEVSSSEDVIKALDAASEKENNLLQVSVELCSLQDVIKPEQIDSHICFEENNHPSSSEQNTSEENEQSSCPDSSTLNCSVCGKMDDLDTMSDATSRPSPISVLEPIFKEDDISPPGSRHFTAVEPIQPRQIKFEEDLSVPIGRISSSRSCADYDKYTFEFVKDVVEMSGLTWDELLRKSLFSDHFIDPSLIDEVDFLPDLLPCDFNLLFDTINEVVIELCWLHYGGMLSVAVAAPFVHPNSKGKSVCSETWKGVNWYLTLEAPPRTLDQIIGKDFATPSIWGDLRLDCENLGIQIQEAILDELVEDTISCCVCRCRDSDIPILLSAEEEGQIMET